MKPQEIIILNRKVNAQLIPSGAHIELPAGTEVFVTQDLGGDYTLRVYGNLVMLEGKDADAIGKEPVDSLAGIDLENTPIEQLVDGQLRTCYDPEIPVNIVDLGLIYDCKIQPLEGQPLYDIHIQMTLTAPGCGMGPTLVQHIQQKLHRIPSVHAAHIEMVFDPPWTQDKMSEAAKLQLGLL